MSDRNFSWGSEPGAAPEPGALLTTHGLARFLLEGPDSPVRLDYGPERAIQADWTESTDERWRHYLATEPDWNPPDSEPELDAARRLRQADAAESVGFRHLAGELRKPPQGAKG